MPDVVSTPRFVVLRIRLDMFNKAARATFGVRNGLTTLTKFTVCLYLDIGSVYIYYQR